METLEHSGADEQKSSDRRSIARTFAGIGAGLLAVAIALGYLFLELQAELGIGWEQSGLVILIFLAVFGAATAISDKTSHGETVIIVALVVYAALVVGVTSSSLALGEATAILLKIHLWAGLAGIAGMLVGGLVGGGLGWLYGLVVGHSGKTGAERTAPPDHSTGH